MSLTEITDKSVWNNFLLNQPSHDGLFLQSWEWGEIQRAEGKTVRRLALLAGADIVAAGSFVNVSLAMGFSYWYCPRGPVGDLVAVLALLRDLKKYWQGKEQPVLLRIELPQAISSELEREIMAAAFVWPELLVRSQSPNSTLLLDLSQSESELLAQMKPKTRYNIKLAERHDVTITEQPDFEAFWRLLEETGQRNHFRLHSKRHYELIMETIAGVKLFFAACRGVTLAAHMIVPFGNTTSYLHGGTREEMRDVMAPYLLHWREIQSAKQAGFSWYDFWGINAPERRGRLTLYQPDWEGYTRFKRGFGGVIREYPGACDRPVRSVVYKTIVLARKLKSIY